MSDFDRVTYEHLVTWVQDGCVSRAQLLGLGATSAEIRRMLRRAELKPRHPGVYVNHTGPLTREQEEWCAVLHHSPAALDRESALPHGPRTNPIQVAMPHTHRVTPARGTFARRLVHFDDWVDPMTSPPRIRLEHAVLRAASAKPDTAERFRALADACQTRRTTPTKLLEALEDHRRLPHGSELRALLGDLESGACSVLEREYLRLERLHGLPAADRQRADRIAGRTHCRDVPYIGFGLDVELDGRAFHDNASTRDADHERDLDTVVASDDHTIRLTYGQVFTRGCATLRKIATILERRGWPGPFVPCEHCPPDVR